MSDFIASTACTGNGNVRTDVSWYPRICLLASEQWRGGMILTGKGKAEFRKFVSECVRLPQGDTDRKELAESIARDVEFWRGMIEDFPDDPAAYEGQEGIIDAWARSGEIPPLREAVAELSMPGLTAEVTEFAEKNFPARAEQYAEREELSSFRVERWLKGTNPFKGDGTAGRDWLPRAELWSSYETWCKYDSGGHPPGNPADFYVALQEKGCIPVRRANGRGFRPPKE